MENLIKLITQEQANKLLSSGDGENYSPLGKFYIKNNIGFTAIDNSEGFAWCEDFNNIEEVENYLEGKIERKEELTMRKEEIMKWECTEECGEFDAPLVTIAINFTDGTDYTENVEYDDEEEVIEDYIKDLIKENGWTNVEDYGWGYFCPFCLDSLS